MGEDGAGALGRCATIVCVMVWAYRCVDVVSRCTLCRRACVRAPVSGFACTEMVWHVCRVHVLRSATWVPAREPSEIRAQPLSPRGLPGHAQGHVGDAGVGRERV